MREGTYFPTAAIEFANSGEAGRWITVAAYPGERPIFDFVNYPLEPQGASAPFPHDLGAILIRYKEYIALDGLEVRNSRKMGINVRDSSHVEVRNCTVDNTFSCGIGVWNSSNVKVTGNTLTRSTQRSLRSYGDPNKEPPHEALSLGGATEFEVAYNHVYNGGKEGIDIKEVSANGTVHHNYVHNMPRQGLYADAWFGLLHDVVFHDNVVHDCEWGMVLSAEGSANATREKGTAKNVIFRNNLVYNNRASGFYLGMWGGDNEREGVWVYNNTFVNNGSMGHWSGPTGNIDLRSQNVKKLYVFNNICVDGGAFEIGSYDNPNENGYDLWATNEVIVSHNLLGALKPFSGGGYPAGYGGNYSTNGENIVLGDPQFVSKASRVFLLKENSPARGVGMEFDGLSTEPDMGAFAYGVENVAHQPQLRIMDEGAVEVTLQAQPWLKYIPATSDDLVTWHNDATTGGHPLMLRKILRADVTGASFVRFETKWLSE